jgi:hypothetical protein
MLELQNRCICHLVHDSHHRPVFYTSIAKASQDRREIAWILDSLRLARRPQERAEGLG